MAHELRRETSSSFEERREALLHLSQEARRQAATAWQSFTSWALQDNVLEVAVGLILAASFTAVVSSLTSDIILPIISLLPFFNRNLEEKFAILRPGLGDRTRGGDGDGIVPPDPASIHFLGSPELRSSSSAPFQSTHRPFEAVSPPNDGWHYNTIQQALDDGAVVLAYGSFVDKIVRFLLIGVSLYSVSRLYGWVSKDNIIKHSTKCQFCRKNVSEKAKRCAFCTSWLDGRED